MNGDEESWAVLVDCLAPVVWATVIARLRSIAHARDVMLMAWLRLADNLPIIDVHAVEDFLVRTAHQESTRIEKLST
jgi:hypothetical protein